MSELDTKQRLPTAGPREPGSARFRSTSAIWIYRVVGLVLLLGLWEAAVRLGWVNRLFLAPPSGIAVTLVQLVATGQIWPNIFETLYETVVGFAAGTIIGAVLGFIIGLSPTVTSVFGPFIAMLNATPRIALAPLFVVWFGIGEMSRIVLVFSLVVFIVLTNTIAGSQDVDRDYLTLARLLSANRWQVITKVALPSVLPWILAGMRLSFAYGLAGAVVGEMFLGQLGLGYLIVAGSGVFNIALIFASLVIVIAIAFVADALMALLERYTLRWRKEDA